MDEARLFSVVCRSRTRSDGPKLEHRKFHGEPALAEGLDSGIPRGPFQPLRFCDMKRANLRVACSFLTRGNRDEDTDRFSLVTSGRTRGNCRKLQRGKFRTDIRKGFFTERVVTLLGAGMSCQLQDFPSGDDPLSGLPSGCRDQHVQQQRSQPAWLTQPQE